MGKHRKAIIAVLCIAGALAMGILWTRREPRYEGHSLSYWLAQMPWQIEETASPDELAAREAISRIGTNAVPFLLKRIRSLSDDPNLKAFDYLPRRVAEPLQESVVSDLLHERQQAVVAAMAFSALGEKATPWVPVLSNLVTAGKNRPIRSASSIALASIGTSALPSIVDCINNPGTRERAEVVASLYYVPGWRTNDAIHDILLGCLRDRDYDVRVHVVYMLSSCRQKQESIIPAFMTALSDASGDRFTSALIRSLASFGTNARPALALIVSYTNSPSDRVQRSATNALHEIAPEIFPRAPEQTGKLEKELMRRRYGLSVATNRPTARTNAAPAQ